MDDPNNLLETSTGITKETEQLDPPILLDSIKLSWPKESAIKDDEQWIKGDMAIEYIKSINSSGTPTSEDTILESLAGEVGDNHRSLGVYVWVSRAFPDRNMRDTRLKWSHYRILANVKAHDDRIYWMDRSINEKLGTRDLEEMIAESKNKTKKCLNCQKSLPAKGRLKLHKDRILVGDFCGYGCLGQYSIQTISNRKGDS